MLSIETKTIVLTFSTIQITFLKMHWLFSSIFKLSLIIL